MLLADATAAGEHLHGPNHPAMLPLLEGQANTIYLLGRHADARALCRRARAMAKNKPTPSPALLLPLVELEARIAVERREPTAPTLANEAEALAHIAFGASGPRAALALLRPEFHREVRESELTAALNTLATLGPSLWATGLLSRLHGLTAARHPAQALALLNEARAAPAYSDLTPETHVALDLLEADALIATNNPTQATARLDDLESLSGPTMPRSVRQRLDYHRGRIALRTGDPGTAVTTLRRAVASYATTYDVDHPEYLEVRAALVHALRAADQEPEADSLAAELTRVYQTLGPAFAPEIAALAR